MLKGAGFYRFFCDFAQVKVAGNGNFCFSDGMKHSLRFLLVVLALGLSACATRPRVQQFSVLPPEQPVRYVTVGQVVMINRDAGFVMVRSSTELPPGTELQSRDKDDVQTATLRVSAEKYASHMIADIMKGKPFPGETVTRKLE